MTASTTPTSVIPLLSSWEAYIRVYPQGTLPGFGRWLLANSETATDFESSIPTLAAYAKKFTTDQSEIFVGVPIRSARPAAEPLPPEGAATPPAHPQPPNQAPNQPPQQLDVTQQSTLLIVRLTRILGFLSKPIMKRSGFTKDMEFAVLVQVKLMDHPNKKELCRELRIENSTGVEITRRLAKKGLLLEEADEKDRRSARLSLTEKGKTVLRQLYEQMSPLYSGFLDALSPEEKKQLVALLSRLNEAHSLHIANLPPIT